VRLSNSKGLDSQGKPAGEGKGGGCVDVGAISRGKRLAAAPLLLQRKGLYYLFLFEPREGRKKGPADFRISYEEKKKSYTKRSRWEKRQRPYLKRDRFEDIACTATRKEKGNEIELFTLKGKERLGEGREGQLSHENNWTLPSLLKKRGRGGGTG